MSKQHNPDSALGVFDQVARKAFEAGRKAERERTISVLKNTIERLENEKRDTKDLEARLDIAHDIATFRGIINWLNNE